MGVSQKGIEYLKRNHWQIEEMVELGRVKFASADPVQVLDLCNRYTEAVYKARF